MRLKAIFLDIIPLEMSSLQKEKEKTCIYVIYVIITETQGENTFHIYKNFNSDSVLMRVMKKNKLFLLPTIS